MALIKGEDHFIDDYMIGEGNSIGALPAEFGTDGKLNQKEIIAASDVKKGQVVEISGDMAVAPTSGASTKVIGVAMFDAKANEPVAVECEGLFKMVASATISAGDKVESAAGGKVAKLSGNDKIGIALNDASTDEHVFVKFSI